MKSKAALLMILGLLALVPTAAMAGTQPQRRSSDVNSAIIMAELDDVSPQIDRILLTTDTYLTVITRGVQPSVVRGMVDMTDGIQMVSLGMRLATVDVARRALQPTCASFVPTPAQILRVMTGPLDGSQSRLVPVLSSADCSKDSQYLPKDPKQAEIAQKFTDLLIRSADAMVAASARR